MKKKIISSLLVLSGLALVSCNENPVTQNTSEAVVSESESKSEVVSESTSESTTSESSSTTEESSTTETSTTETQDNSEKFEVKSLKNVSPYFLTVEDGLNVGEKYAANSVVSVTLKAGEYLSQGFLEANGHIDHIYLNVNGKNYKPHFLNGQTESQYCVVDFLMPEEDVDIIVCYSIQQHVKEDGHKVSIEENDNVKLIGVDEAEKYDYIDCYLVTNDDFRIDEVLYKFKNDTTWTTMETYGSVSYTKLENGVYELQIRPDYLDLTDDVEIKVSGEVCKTYKLTYKNIVDDYLIDGGSSMPEIAFEGDAVSVSFGVKSGVYIKSLTIDGVAEDDIYYNDGDRASFLMPSNDVTISLEFAKEPKITLGTYDTDIITYVSVNQDFNPDATSQIKNAKPGTSFYIFAQAVDNKMISKIYLNDEEFDVTYYNGYFYANVYMPFDGSDVKVTFETKDSYKVSYEKNDNATVYLDSTVYASGDNTRFSVYTTDGYKIKSVKLVDDSNNDVTDSCNLYFDANYGSFTMPSYNVKVVVELEEASTETFSINAHFDSSVYSVSDQTNWKTDFPYELKDGSSFYLSVTSYSDSDFYVYVTVDSKVVIDTKVTPDEETGEPGSFGKSILVTGNVEIYVSETKHEEESTSYNITVNNELSDYYFSIRDSKFNDYTDGGSVDKDSNLYLTVQADDYYDTYHVSVVVNGETVKEITVDPDEETGEPGSVSFSLDVIGDVVINIK